MNDALGPMTNEHALRMGHALVLNALVMASAWRFVRGVDVGDSVQRVADTLLIWLAVQYASVMVCGVAGVLNGWTMTAVALTACGALWFSGMRFHREDLEAARAPAWERYVAWGCVGFLVGYGGAVLWNQYYVAVMSDDALTYHVPAAVRWLQSGRIVWHEVWFFNPANTYSPLAGSALVAWWFAPLGNDWLARFVQVPGLALIFVGMIRLGRLLGAPLAVAALVALAAALSRPFMRQIIVTKDDLYLAGFFLAAVLALTRENAGERLGPWRAGLAAGLFLATKYTALLTLPVLLLMIDGPVRAKWRPREWGIAAAVTTLVAGPWFVRNWWVTGNPVFPIDVSVAGVRLFEGMFATRRSEELATFAGVWRILTGPQTHFSMLAPLFVTLAAGWLAAAVAAGRRIIREPLMRACVLGPPLGIGLFVFTSPYSEVRFVDPAFLLMFGCAALALGARPARTTTMAAAAALSLGVVLPGLSVFTGFQINRWTFIGVGAAMAGGGVVAAVLQDRVLRLRRRGRLVVGVAAALAIAAYLYVHQDVDIGQYRRLTYTCWATQYGRLADAWVFVRMEVPPEAVIAYTNTNYTYPLMGFGADRRVVYAPTRPGVTSLHTLPRLPQAVPGERLMGEVARITVEAADRDVWLENLRSAGADYLLVAHSAMVTEPPELAFARAEPERFERVFENETGIVYRIRW